MRKLTMVAITLLALVSCTDNQRARSFGGTETVKLEQYELDKGSQIFEKDCYNYANLLKQHLNIGMFVPCDEDGDILDEPKDYEQRLPNMMTEYNDEIYRYKQAKEKVLFEGFYIERGSTDVDSLTTYLMHNNFGDIAFKKDWKDEWEFIEDLDSLSNLNEIELTETAIKQIGL